MKYLTVAEIIKINKTLIKRYSPKEIIGVREPGALEILVKAPQQIIFGKVLYPTIFDKAAILMINLATKHAFHNANKRTAITSTHVFMKLNNYDAEWDFEEAIYFVMNTVKMHDENIEFEEIKNIVAKMIEEKYHIK